MKARGTLAGVLAGMVSLLGCHSAENSTRDEARALLDVLGRLEAEAPAMERKAGLSELQGLELRDAGLLELRGLCLSAHAGLLEVQLLQAEARSLMAHAAPGDANQAAHVADVRDILQRAEAALGAARAAGDQCRTLSRAAAERYR